MPDEFGALKHETIPLGMSGIGLLLCFDGHANSSPSSNNLERGAEEPACTADRWLHCWDLTSSRSWHYSGQGETVPFLALLQLQFSTVQLPFTCEVVLTSTNKATAATKDSDIKIKVVQHLPSVVWRGFKGKEGKGGREG